MLGASALVWISPTESELNLTHTYMHTHSPSQSHLRQQEKGQERRRFRIVTFILISCQTRTRKVRPGKETAWTPGNLKELRPERLVSGSVLCPQTSERKLWGWGAQGCFQQTGKQCLSCDSDWTKGKSRRVVWGGLRRAGNEGQWPDPACKPQAPSAFPQAATGGQQSACVQSQVGQGGRGGASWNESGSS